MKLSVIIGLVQMGFGVILKAFNAIHQGSRLDFFFEFIPQMMFMASIFFYMDFLIIYKWLKDWTGIEDKAPSIITTMINLPLNLGKTVSFSPERSDRGTAYVGVTRQYLTRHDPANFAYYCSGFNSFNAHP